MSISTPKAFFKGKRLQSNSEIQIKGEKKLMNSNIAYIRECLPNSLHQNQETQMRIRFPQASFLLPTKVSGVMKTM